MLPDWKWAAAGLSDLDEDTFLVFYAGAAVLLFMVGWLLRDIARTTERRPDLRDLGAVELAYLFGGVRRAADTLYLALAARGAAATEGVDIVVAGASGGLPPSLEAFRVALHGRHRRRRFVGAVRASAPFGATLELLAYRKILLGANRRRAFRHATWWPGGLLLAIGAAEAALAGARGEPPAMLIVVMVATVAGIQLWLGRERYLTREAQASLAALRDSRSHLLRAPSPEEVAFAFAIVGTVALEGADLALAARPSRGNQTNGRDAEP